MDKKYLDYNGLLYFWQKLKNEFKDIDYVATGANVYLTGYTSGSTGDIASSDTVNVALSKLETKADSALTSGVLSFGGQTGNITILGDQATNGSVNLAMNNKQLTASIVGLKSAAYVNTGTTSSTIPLLGGTVTSKTNYPVLLNSSGKLIAGTAALGSAAYSSTDAFDVAGAAAAVLGGSSDASSATTVYGARALAQSALDAIGQMHGIEYTVVQSLPATGDSKYIYLLAHNHGTGDVYDEYIWVASANKFEKIGNTDIDLTGY